MAKKSLSGYDLNAPLLLSGSAGTAGYVLTSAGSSSAPSWAAVSSGGLSASSYVTTGRLSADQSISTNSDTLISFIADADPQGWWNASTKRFTPTIAGYYNITINVWWAAGASYNGQYNTQVRKNTNTFAIFQSPINTIAGAGLAQGGSKIIYLNGSTDYVDFTVYNGGGSSVNISYGGNSNGQGVNFSAELITSGANMTSNQLTFGTNGLTMTTGSSPWNGSAAATVDIDTTKVATLTGIQALSNKTSYNGLALTSATTGFTIAGGTTSKTLTLSNTITIAGVDTKTITVNNSITLAGTDATVMTFPATNATIARTDAGQTFTGTQIIDTIGTSITTTGTAALFNTGITTGTISIGGSITTGTVNIATGTAGAKTIGIGTSTGTTTLYGIVNHPGTFQLAGTTVSSTAAQLNYLSSATGTQGTTSTSVVFSGSPTITSPIIDVINAASATATTTSLYGNTTSGTIGIGTSIGSTASVGTLNIANNAGTAGGTKAINLGTGATAGTTTITIGSSVGSTTTINGTLALGNALPYNYGGTGLNSYAKGDLIYASATNTLAKLTISTNDGYVLTANATSGVAEWRASSGGSSGFIDLQALTFNYR